MKCSLVRSAFFAINPKSEIDLVSPCTTARKRLYSVAGERDIIHKISEREFLLHGQFLLDWKSDLPIMANVLSLIMSVDKEH
jgi:hypothetical protein